MGIVNHQPLPLTAGAQTQGLYDASHEHDACGVHGSEHSRQQEPRVGRQRAEGARKHAPQRR